MRLVLDKFEVLSDKISKPLKLVLISDIHLCKNFFLFENINTASLLRGLKKIQNIDFFVLDGDYVNSARDYLHEKTLEKFKKLLETLGKIAPVLMISGNHDAYFKTKKSEEIYTSFSKIHNVIQIDNKQLEMFGIKITGFSPTRETYHASKHGKQAQFLAKKEFESNNFSFNKTDFNLILTHSPYCLSNKIMENNARDFFRTTDLILSGHMHNGLIFSRNLEIINKILRGEKHDLKLRKLVRKYADAGIWYVYKTIFLIRECRGARFFGKSSNDVFLPSSKAAVQIDLSQRKDETLQMTTKGVNKYAVVPFYVGRPSVIELTISPKK